MSEEKYRKEHRDRAPMPGFARAMIVLSVVQIVFSMGLHILEYTDQLLVVMLGIAALVIAVMAAFMWNGSRTFRNVVRGALIGVPSIVIALGAFSAIYASVYNPDSDPFYNWELYGSIAAQFTQLVLVLMLPALVAAASYGARTDRAILSVSAIVNVGLVAFITYYVAGDMGMIDFVMDNPIIKLVYVLLTAVFAALTFIRAIGNDPDHTICKK